MEDEGVEKRPAVPYFRSLMYKNTCGEVLTIETKDVSENF